MAHIRTRRAPGLMEPISHFSDSPNRADQFFPQFSAYQRGTLLANVQQAVNLFLT